MTTTPPAPTLNAVATPDPSPRVEITIALPGDAARVTVWRQFGTDRQYVRGAVNTVASGTWLVVDYEAPIGVPVTYQCQSASSAGVPSALSPMSVAASIEVPQLWLSDPLAPASAVAVNLPPNPSIPGTDLTLVDGSFAAFPRAFSDFTVAPVFGSPLPVGHAGVQQAPAGIPFQIFAATEDASTSLRTLLGQAFPLCVRTPALITALPGLVYMGLPSVTDVPHGNGETTWQFEGTCIVPPGAQIIVPPRTWDDVQDESPDWTGLVALYASWNAELVGP